MARKCRHCRVEIPPKAKSDKWQAAGFCNLDHMSAHGLKKAKEAIARKERREHMERKERLKTKSDYIKEAQKAVNDYVRHRDQKRACICCDHRAGQSYLCGGEYDAGHYRSRCSCPSLRFYTLNIHKQRKQCNRDKSGNHVAYRICLIKKIGEEKVLEIEHYNGVKKFTIERLKRITSVYRRKLRHYKKLRQA